MVKRPVTFFVDEDVYEQFKEFYDEDSVVISTVIERFMEENLRSEGVALRDRDSERPHVEVSKQEGDVIHSVAFGEGFKARPRDRAHTVEEHPVERKIKEEVLSRAPIVHSSMKQDNPKRYLPKHPIPTIEELRERKMKMVVSEHQE